MIRGIFDTKYLEDHRRTMHPMDDFLAYYLGTPGELLGKQPTIDNEREELNMINVKAGFGIFETTNSGIGRCVYFGSSVEECADFGTKLAALYNLNCEEELWDRFHTSKALGVTYGADDCVDYRAVSSEELGRIAKYPDRVYAIPISENLAVAMPN